MSKDAKKAFKYSLVATLINAFSGKYYTEGTLKNLEITKEILNSYALKLNVKKTLAHIKPLVINSLRESHFIKPTDKTTIDKLYLFFRQKINDLQDGKRFARAFEYTDYIKLDKRFGQKIHPHHLIDFSLGQGLIPTMPEMLTYIDLLNNWNYFIEKNDLRGSISGNNIERQTAYEQQTSSKQCIVSAVIFVESYLHYLFYNYKYLKIDKTNLNSLYSMEDRKITDKMILKKLVTDYLLIDENPENKEKFIELNQNYNEILKIRDSIVHTTISDENGTGSPIFLNLQFDIETKKFKEAIESCFNLVTFIDEILPEENKLLFWMDFLEKLDFNSNSRLQYVKERSRT